MLLLERGIELNEVRSHEKGAFSSTITAEVRGGERTVKASGTVFGHNMPRLVMLDDHRLEAYIDGNLLIFTHTDMPGMIGHVGSVFGKHQVNIAQMSVGRSGTQQGGDAIGVLNLDSQPTAASLQELLALRGISRVQPIQLPPAGKLPSWLQG